MKISYSFKAIAAQVASILQASGINVSKWNGTAVAAPDTAGYPKTTIKSGTGTGELDLSSGKVAVQKVIKSIQYGTIAIADPDLTATATIASVDTSKAVLISLGQTIDSATGLNSLIRLSLTSATVVTATRTGGVSGITPLIGFVVVEYQ